MSNEKGHLIPDEMPFDLKDEIGEIKAVQEFIPGVYYLTAQKESCAADNFYVVMESAAIFAAVSRYGRQFAGLRLYPVNEDASGWRIVEYELGKYQITHNRELISDEAEQNFIGPPSLQRDSTRNISGNILSRSGRPGVIPSGIRSWRTAFTGWKPASARKCWQSVTLYGIQSLPALPG